MKFGESISCGLSTEASADPEVLARVREILRSYVVPTK